MLHHITLECPMGYDAIRRGCSKFSGNSLMDWIRSHAMATLWLGGRRGRCSPIGRGWWVFLLFQGEENQPLPCYLLTTDSSKMQVEVFKKLLQVEHHDVFVQQGNSLKWANSKCPHVTTWWKCVMETWMPASLKDSTWVGLPIKVAYHRLKTSDKRPEIMLNKHN